MFDLAIVLRNLFEIKKHIFKNITTSFINENRVVYELCASGKPAALFIFMVNSITNIKHSHMEIYPQI